MMMCSPLDFIPWLFYCSLKLVPPIVEKVKSTLGLDSHLNTVVSQADLTKHLQQCSAAAAKTIDLTLHKEFIGIFQPPGHKGPF